MKIVGSWYVCGLVAFHMVKSAITLRFVWICCSGGCGWRAFGMTILGNTLAAIVFLGIFAIPYLLIKGKQS